jgi:hypothetical protein
MSDLLEAVKKTVKKARNKDKNNRWKDYKKVTMPNGSKGWIMKAAKSRQYT